MKRKRVFVNNSYRFLVGRRRKEVIDLIKLRSESHSNDPWEREEKSDDIPTFEVVSEQTKPNGVTMALSRMMIRARRRIRNFADGGLYYINVYKDWIGYMFCYIVVKKKKPRGVLKSVRI